MDTQHAILDSLIVMEIPRMVVKLQDQSVIVQVAVILALYQMVNHHVYLDLVLFYLVMLHLLTAMDFTQLDAK